jgi:hypothetical protein
MTAKFKDFGSGTPNNSDEPIVFRLFDEEFQCYTQLPGKVLLDFIVESSSDDPVASAGLINKFFRAVLKAESYERFEKLAEDPERVVSVEMLGEITTWLMESYTNRPEQQPEAS